MNSFVEFDSGVTQPSIPFSKSASRAMVEGDAVGGWVGAGDGTGVGAFVGAGVTGCSKCLRCSSSECICDRNLARARPWGMPSKDTMALSESISALRSLTSSRFSASSVFSCLCAILWYSRSSCRSCCVRSEFFSVPSSAASVARSSAVNVGSPLGKECAERVKNASTRKLGHIVSVPPTGSVVASILYNVRTRIHAARCESRDKLLLILVVVELHAR